MKKIFVFIATIIMCLFMAVWLTACEDNATPAETVDTFQSRYVVIGKDKFVVTENSLYVYMITVYDKETLVMYMIVTGSSYQSGEAIIMLVDENGQPLLYKGEA